MYAKLNPFLDRRQKLVQAKKSSFEIQVQDADGGLMSEAQIDQEINLLTGQIEILQKQIGEFDTYVPYFLYNCALHRGLRQMHEKCCCACVFQSYLDFFLFVFFLLPSPPPPPPCPRMQRSLS